MLEAPSLQGGHRMKLHANAALSLRQRERMVRRVVEQGWSITKAAAAAEVSERPAAKWVRRYRAEGELRAAGSLLGAGGRSPTAPTSRRSRRSPRCGGCGSPARRSPSCSGWPLSTVSGILTRIGMGQLGRLGLEPAERYERAAAGRADPHRRQEARAHPRRRRQARSAAAARTTPARCTDAAGVSRARRRLGVRAHRDRRRHPPGLRRSAARREGHAPRSRSCAARVAFYRAPRHHRRAS